MLKPRVAQFKEPEQFSILIVCEDSKSAVYYFERKVKECGLSKTATIEKIDSFDIAVDVEGSKTGSAPKSVVDYAISKRDEYNKQAKKKGMYPYKAVYCVMDVDDHSTLNEAIDKIHSVNSTSIDSELIHIVSNENFEVWYLLHFMEYSTKELHRPPSKKTKSPRKIFIPPDQRIDKLIETFLGEDYEELKSYPQIFQLIKEKGGDEQQALQYANKLAEYHREHSPDKPVYLSNPSTEVSQLIIKLNELAELRKPINPSQMGDITQIDLKNADYPFKDNELTNTLRQLINKHYSQETKARKVALLIDMFKNPYHNTASREHPNIALYFYQHYPS